MKKRLFIGVILTFFIFFGIVNFVKAEEVESTESEDKQAVVVTDNATPVAQSDSSVEEPQESQPAPENVPQEPSTETISNSNDSELSGDNNADSQEVVIPNNTNTLEGNSTQVDNNNNDNESTGSNDIVSDTNVNVDPTKITTLASGDNNINNESDEVVDEPIQTREVTTTTINRDYKIESGEGKSVTLSKIFEDLSIDINLADVTNVESSSPTQIVVTSTSGDWTISSPSVFLTQETLTVETEGTRYVIRLTDTTVPDHSKELIDNGDGTYTLELTITGEAEKQPNNVNVIVILDVSGSMDTTATTETTYTPTTGNGNNLYGLVNNEYVALTRTGRGANSRYWYNYPNWIEYTGQRYTRQNANNSRLDEAQDAVNSLAEALLANNGKDGNPVDTVEISLITFSNGADIAQTPTTDFATFQSTVNALDADGGTNWEAALKKVSNVNFGEGDNDPVYVIFVSDGAPTFRDTRDGHNDWNGDYGAYGTGYEQQPNMQRSYDNAIDDATNVVTAIGSKNFYTIFAYGGETGANYMTSLTTESGGVAANNYTAANTAGLQEAFNSILTAIEMAGFGNVGLDDGTTSYVEHTNYETTSDVSQLLVVDESSYKYYKIKNGVQEEWTDAPSASLDDKGHVVWNLSEEGVLENGVTYKVTFRVWPSQETLDLIADLKNDPSLYNSLDGNITKYLVEDGNGGYTLLTNTVASLTFTDTRDDNPQETTATYSNPEPVKTMATELLSITKEWDNDIDDKDKSPVTLKVLKDGEDWETISLGGDKWTDSRYISIGIMTVDENGQVTILDSGHDFSFGELGSDVYNWELKAQTVHPMLVNGKLVILIYDGTTAPTSGTEGVDWFKINVGTAENPSYKYYLKGEETQTASLTATNERRSWIDITKAVEYDPQSAHFDDQTFTFEITVQDKEAQDVWFSIKETKDKDSRFITAADGLVVTEAQKENGTEYYFVPSGRTFTVSMKAGWNLRIINLLKGTTYTINEINIDPKFEFKNISYNNTTYVDENGTTVSYVPTISSKTVSGEIKSANVAYEYTYTNKNVLTEIVVTKIWDDGDNQNRPDTITLHLYNGTKEVSQPTTYTVDTKTGNWVYTYVELPVYDANGNKITYTLGYSNVQGEDKVDGYLDPVITGDAINGYFVTNTLAANVKVVKVWSDANNQDGKRKDVNAVVTLLANGEDAGEQSQNVGITNDWSYTWTNLPAYINGVAVVYTVNETMADGSEYTFIPGEAFSATTDVNGTITITNSYEPKTISVIVTKVWNDASNQDGKRKNVGATAQLLANGVDAGKETATVGTADGWSYTWTNLPVYANGVAIVYTVNETMADGSEYLFDGSTSFTAAEETNGTITITNSYEPKTINITVAKVWSDANNQDGKRTNVGGVATLLANGEDAGKETAQVGTTNNWTYTWTNLPVYADGVAIVYTVNETMANTSEYTFEGSTSYEATEDTNGTITITNSYEPKTINVTVTKVWLDESNQDGKRKSVGATAQLLANGVDAGQQTQNVGITDNWSYTWTNLPVYANGVAIVYTVNETMADGSEYSFDGSTSFTAAEETNGTITITNSYEPKTINVTVTKVWNDTNNQDGKRKDVNAVVTLLANGEDAGEQSQNVGITNDWSYTWTNLPVYANGVAIVYTVNETMADGSEYTIGRITSYTASEDTNGTITVTNNYNVKTTQVTVTKVWNDADNQDGKRKNVGATAILLANGVDAGEEVQTVSTEDGWTYTWTNLPVYANGVAIVYTVNETMADGSEYTFEGSTSYEATEDTNGTITITNSYEPKTINITVTKVWDDANNQDGKRTNVGGVATLLANGEDAGEQSQNVGITNDWSYTWTNLPVYANGVAIVYTVNETMADGSEYTFEGSTSYEATEETNGTITITNSYEPKTTSITVTKVWDDASNQDGKRKDVGATVTLLANGTDAGEQSQRVSTEDGWSYTWTNLPVYANGVAIVYTVNETMSDNSEYTIDEITSFTANEEENGTITVTNSYEPKTTSITVTKVWDDASNQDGKRKNVGATVTLLADGQDAGKETATVGTADDWSYTWTNLPVYANGVAIVYTVNETMSDGSKYTIDEITSFTASEEENGTITITNSYEPEKVDVTVTKVWDDKDDQDGIRPESLVVTLSDGTEVTLTAADKWTATVEGLPKYKDGEEIKYTWTEGELPEGYTMTSNTTEGLVTTITNTHEVEKADVTVTKVWEDNNNQDGIRPEEIEVTLYANGEKVETVKLNESNDWSYTFEKLDVKANGKDIEYTVSEVSVDGYTTTIDGLTITNTHETKTREVTVSKVWDDKDNYEGLRPASVTIILKADGEEVNSVELNESNNWTYTWTELDYYKDGSVITYTVEENEVPEYYTEITGDMDEGFVVTNTHFGSGGDVPPSDNPKTADNVVTYIAMMLISLLGLIRLSYAYIKNN